MGLPYSHFLENEEAWGPKRRAWLRGFPQEVLKSLQRLEEVRKFDARWDGKW